MEVLERESVDAVLTDVNMPSMDGFALTEAIRRTPRLQHLPVIVLSGAGANEDAARSSTAGANACLNKGTTNPDEILDLLARTWSE